MKLKIAIVGSKSFDTLGYHFKDTFTRLGFQSEIFDIPALLPSNISGYLARFSLQYKSMIYNKLADELINYDPNLILVTYKNIPSFIIEKLKRKTKAIVVVYMNDNIREFDRGYIFISDYDAVFVKDKYSLSFFKEKLKMKAYYLPESFNPYCHRSTLDEKCFCSKYNTTLVGNLYPYRLKIINEILDQTGFTLFGNCPKWIDKNKINFEIKPDKRGQEKSDIFYTSKINLNTLRCEEINGANCRVFEIAGSGGFQICDRKEAIKELFEEDKEIVLFDTIEELKEKIDYYLKHPDKRFEIAENARKRALAKHTYEHRVREMMKILGM